MSNRVKYELWIKPLSLFAIASNTMDGGKSL